MRELVITSNAPAAGFSGAAQPFSESLDSPDAAPAGSEWYLQAPMLVVTTAVSGIENAIICELEGVLGVDAVFLDGDADDGVVRVYSVVRDHTPEIYEPVLEAEERIRARLPQVPLDFRVRAHQGRGVRRAVPVGTNPIFVR